MENPTTSEVLYQSIIAFFFLFLLARILGKRQIAQLTFFDYIVGISIGNIAASWSLDEVKTTHAILSLCIWTVLCFALAILQKKSYMARVLLDGRPTVLIRNGQILEKNLGKVHMSLEELDLMLRQKDVFKLSDVEYAVFENNGTLSVNKKTELQPVTPKDLNMSVIPEHESRIVVIDGNLMERSLKATGYTKEWLLGELMKQGATGLQDVFCAQIDSLGNVYVDLYMDANHLPEIKKKPLLAASLKKLQADVEMFSLQTNNEVARQSFTKMAKTLQSLVVEMSPYLKE